MTTRSALADRLPAARLPARRCVALLAGGLTLVAQLAAAPFALAQATATPPATTTASSPTHTPAALPAGALGDLTNRAWFSARTSGKADTLVEALRDLPEGAGADATALRESALHLEKSLAKREQTREEKLKTVREKLDKQLETKTPESLSEAVRSAVELYLLSPDKDAVKRDPKITDLIKQADTAAREAEAKGDWFTANEMFFRLKALLEEEGTYNADFNRLGQRLKMIRLYAPEQFWKLRNDERLQSKKPGLPPYNGLGENFREKIEGIDKTMVLRAISAANRQQIDRVAMKDLMLGGIETIRTMMTTTDLRQAFPTLSDDTTRQSMLTFLEQWSARLRQPGALVTSNTLVDFVDDLASTNRTTTKLPEGVLLHEFGNGAIGKLDDFSAIIWPDELSRFDRMTQGNFKGIGVQIQLDDETQMIKIVTPLEGTPAQRAGIRAGDLIKKINGQSAAGISLNQAVDLITGPADSKVSLTVERTTNKGAKDGGEIVQEIDFPLVRAVIPVTTVKGWRRTGAHEDDWDWFVDKQNQIGYVRLTQFTEDTTSDLHAAIKHMRENGGVKGLVLDLRFNPGGLLTEAVSVANTFINKGLIVSTEGTVQGERKDATEGAALIRDIPIAVLINEGSASASEIVSGAMRHYADKGELNAILVGQRSYGKGSVQNVWPLANNAKMKLTTQYYKLPDGRIIHKRPGAATWGVDPHVKVELLPEAESEALKLRLDADVLPIDSKGNVVESATPRPDPDKLITDGIDIQLETALLMLKARSVSGSKPAEQAQAPAPVPTQQ